MAITCFLEVDPRSTCYKDVYYLLFYVTSCFGISSYHGCWCACCHSANFVIMLVLQFIQSWFWYIGFTWCSWSQICACSDFTWYSWSQVTACSKTTYDLPQTPPQCHNDDLWCQQCDDKVGIMTTLSYYMTMTWQADIILCMRPANERRRYNVTTSLFGWVHIQNDPWTRATCVTHVTM